MSDAETIDPKEIIDRIDRHCASVGISPSTLCVRAVGNSRFYARLLRRMDRDQVAFEKILAYISGDQIPETPEGAAR